MLKHRPSDRFRSKRRAGSIALVCAAIVASLFIGIAPASANTDHDTLLVRAKGADGRAEMAIRVKGDVVDSVVVSPTYEDYVFDLGPDPVDLDDIEVAFVNDQGSGRNLDVDYIEFNGTRYESESPDTFSVGSWDAGTQCDGGNKESETLHCNGFFRYSGEGSPPPPPPPPPMGDEAQLYVYAYGSTGSELMQIRVNGETLKEFAVTTELAEYPMLIPAGVPLKDIEIAFVNNGGSGATDRNLIVDYIVFDGVEYQTEAATTYSEGSWTAADGCDPGNKESETLHCNGFFRFEGEQVPPPPDIEPEYPECDISLPDHDFYPEDLTDDGAFFIGTYPGVGLNGLSGPCGPEFILDGFVGIGQDGELRALFEYVDFLVRQGHIYWDVTASCHTNFTYEAEIPILQTVTAGDELQAVLVDGDVIEWLLFITEPNGYVHVLEGSFEFSDSDCLSAIEMHVGENGAFVGS